MQTIADIERQIRIARGRIQRDRNAIKRGATGEALACAKRCIQREQAFIRMAKQAIEAQKMTQKFEVVADALAKEIDNNAKFINMVIA